MSDRCPVCSSAVREDLEDLIRRADRGEFSWRKAAVRASEASGRTLVHTQLQRHLPHMGAEAQNRLSEAVASAIGDLRSRMELAPAEVKPLYLVAIHNLELLHRTPPSQKNLVDALRTIEEMTGMRAEQRLMLTFAQAFFREIPSSDRLQIPAEVVDVEQVE